MVALCSTIFLSLASQTNNIWAGESYKINNTVAKNYEVKYENITKLDLKTEKQLSNNKIKDYLTEQVKLKIQKWQWRKIVPVKYIMEQ